MPTPLMTRRAALSGLGALGLAAAAPSTASAHSEKPLLVPHYPCWENDDFMTIGIGPTGHHMILGQIPNLWLGRGFVAIAGVEPWRVPGAVDPDAAFEAETARRGRPFALVIGDLAEPRWLDVTAAIMAAARRAGRFVVAAAACPGADGHSFDTIVRRLEPVCDAFIANADVLPDWVDQNVLIAQNIEAIAATAAMRGGRAIAARMAPGIYKAGHQAMTWWPGRSILPSRLRSASTPPALLAWHLPFFTPARIEHAFHRARQALPKSTAALSATAHQDGAIYPGDRVSLCVSWLVRIA